MDEKQLIQRSIDGDENAFKLLIDGCREYWKGIAFRKFTLSNADYDDARQNTIFKIFKHLNTFKFESTFRTWSARIIQNEIITILRKNQVLQNRFVSLCNDSDDNFERDYSNSLHHSREYVMEYILDKDNTENITKMLDLVFEKLDKNSSEILTLFLKQGKSQKEIAKILKIPLGSVMSRIFNARKKAQRLVIAAQNRLSLEYSV